MSEKISVRGDGLFQFGGVDHHLHWIAEISREELIRYLEGGYSEGIDKASWRLNDGREIDHTYLGLDLTRPKDQVTSIGMIRAEHPLRGWISVHDFLMQSLMEEGHESPHKDHATL